MIDVYTEEIPFLFLIQLVITKNCLKEPREKHISDSFLLFADFGNRFSKKMMQNLVFYFPKHHHQLLKQGIS